MMIKENVEQMAEMMRMCNENNVNPFGYMEYAHEVAQRHCPGDVYPHPSEIVWPVLGSYKLLITYGKNGRTMNAEHMRRFYGQ